MSVNELPTVVLSSVIGVLLLCIAFLIWVIGRLTDKLMSRNYYDYKVTTQLDVRPKTDTIRKNMEVQEDQSVEDLGYINGMG